MHPFEAITSHEWSVPAELGLPWIPAEQVIGMFPCMTTSWIYSSFCYLPVHNTQKIEAFKARWQTWPVCYAYESSISYLFKSLNSCDHWYIHCRKHKDTQTGVRMLHSNWYCKQSCMFMGINFWFLHRNVFNHNREGQSYSAEKRKKNP